MPVQWTSMYSYTCVVRERACVQPAVLFLKVLSIDEGDMGDFIEKLLFCVYSELTVVFYYHLFKTKRKTVIYIPFQLYCI